jgi:hypothetical protein
VSALNEETLQKWVKRTDGSFTPDMLSTFETGVESPRPAAAFPTWDRTSDAVKVVYYMRLLQRRAADLGGDGYAFTVNVSAEVEALAKAKNATFLKVMQERVAQHLKAKVGRGFWYWFTIEISPTKRPHLHGCFAAEASQLAGIASAFKSATRVRGAADPPRTYHLTPITDAAGWADYATKDRHRSQAKFAANGLVVDRLISANQDLRQRAENDYLDDYKTFWWAISPSKMHPLYGMF